MISTNKGKIIFIGHKDEIMTDLCFIMVEMVEKGALTFEEIEHLIQIAKENI